ncbi:hypothetical protein PISMIDRAFT_416448 [Pisolithus microcarpus 441]|uniref:Uncharacterized protein n=1 Tax=Pisolithus microcarpus 441 TaxID=765257 RepID=A0A0C9YH11_9AGAM|nr:hypothetical protein PISMIDRAFT_416448 [Pisolithus microcarpus 441]
MQTSITGRQLFSRFARLTSLVSGSVVRTSKGACGVTGSPADHEAPSIRSLVL